MSSTYTPLREAWVECHLKTSVFLKRWEISSLRNGKVIHKWWAEIHQYIQGGRVRLPSEIWRRKWVGKQLIRQSFDSDDPIYKCIHREKTWKKHCIIDSSSLSFIFLSSLTMLAFIWKVSSICVRTEFLLKVLCDVKCFITYLFTCQHIFSRHQWHILK